jgi:hypothetical protein
MVAGVARAAGPRRWPCAGHEERPWGSCSPWGPSAAPLLVAVPAVIVVLRLYQLLLRGLARASAGRRGVIGFLGLTRAAQATATLALPAVTLVLTLTVAAFTIMLRDAVVRGETTVSWQETGADVVVGAPGQLSTGAVISPAAVRAIAAVPGVQHAATALVIPVSVARGEVTVIAVDPASYAALVTSTEGFAAVSPARLSSALSPPDPGGLRVVPAAAGGTPRGHRHRAGLRDQVGTRPRRRDNASMRRKS